MALPKNIYINISPPLGRKAFVRAFSAFQFGNVTVPGPAAQAVIARALGAGDQEI
jgi:hypothetical protein